MTSATPRRPIVRSVARPIKAGAAPAEVAGAVCRRHGPAVRLPDLRGAHRADPDQPTSPIISSFLLINAAIILVLVGIIVREVCADGAGRGAADGRRRGCTSRSSACSPVIAVLPAVLVADRRQCDLSSAASTGCSQDLRKRGIQNSLSIASCLHAQEHAQAINGDILGMANDIAHARPLYDQDR